MKLKTIEIKEFRGATQALKLEFNSSKSMSMIFGENGNGKSSIADAFIVLWTDNLGYLFHSFKPFRKFNAIFRNYVVIRY